MSERVAGPTTDQWVMELLTEARARTLLLIAPLSDDELRQQHDPLMSPILWDLGHIAHFEELWLTRNLAGPIEFSEMPGMYNPFEHPRASRAGLPLPTLADCFVQMASIRRRVLDALGELDLSHDDSPLVRDGYVFRMVAQHEYQHNETILQTLQLKKGAPYRAPRAILPPRAAAATPLAGMQRFPGGEVPIGTDDRSAAYDNERPQHIVGLRPFWLDTVPVTNGDYLEFMEAGGYSERRFWSDAGWKWVQESAVRAPKYWEQDAGEWIVRTMDERRPVPADHPVCHVCFHEAEAFARWSGKRLPTELEWEAAATFDPATGRSSVYPWGDEPPTVQHANVDQLSFSTAPTGAYPTGVSPIGCHQMIGDVWEWTASDLTGYPGFEAFPYREYSEAFFGSEYKVLRGGSWATRPSAIRASFRNWDYPIRRQIFSGFRCARDD